MIDIIVSAIVAPTMVNKHGHGRWHALTIKVG